MVSLYKSASKGHHTDLYPDRDDVHPNARIHIALFDLAFGNSTHIPWDVYPLRGYAANFGLEVRRDEMIALNQHPGDLRSDFEEHAVVHLQPVRNPVSTKAILGDHRWGYLALLHSMHDGEPAQEPLRILLSLDACARGLSTCGLRLCNKCHLKKAARLSDSLAQKFDVDSGGSAMSRPTIWFLTLTMPNSETLDEGIKRISATWKKFRQRRAWRDVAKTGMWKIEATCNEDWNTHLHIVIQSPTLNEAKAWGIADEWARCADAHGSSQMVTECFATKEAIRRVARYIAKPVITLPRQSPGAAQRPYTINRRVQEVVELFVTSKKLRLFQRF